VPDPKDKDKGKKKPQSDKGKDITKLNEEDLDQVAGGGGSSPPPPPPGQG
jgi:hypothetical protein